MKRFLKSWLLGLPVLGVMAVSSMGVAAAASLPAHTLNNPLVAASSASKSDVCEGIGLTGGNCGDNGRGLSDVIKNIIKVMSILVGIVAVIMLIIGGFKYITSAGDASGIASAKNTIIYAIVGLIIVALAQVIVQFVIGQTK
jgi:hypothetical protein